MQFIRQLYFTARWYFSLAFLVGLLVLAFFFPALFGVARVLVGVLALLALLDGVALFRTARGIFARRQMAEKLSNGSDNDITIYLENHYSFNIQVEVIDELPVQLQLRDTSFKISLPAGETHLITYRIRPAKRGVYSFGAVNAFVSGPLGLVRRRYRFAQNQEVPVYPSFIQMRQFELRAFTNQLSEHGLKKVRRVGHQAEFEQIRPYTPGDDPRVINWQATARRSELMVNSFQDEKSQPVYCLIDKGRVMKMPFEGLSLLDYAINAALVLANIALKKQDKAGIITFAERVGTILPADRKAAHLQKVLDLLYHQKTRYLESDFESLYAAVRTKIKHRSLLVLFTNFETLLAAQRQLPYLKKLARHHLVLVVFFENTELRTLLDEPARTTEEIYHKAIAEKFDYEKRQIVKEFNRHGLHALLTSPHTLTVNTLNKYLEFKARGLL